MIGIKAEDRLPADIRALFDLEYHEGWDRCRDEDQAKASAWRAVKELYEQDQTGEWRPKKQRKESTTMLQDLERKTGIPGLHILSEPAAIILFETETPEGEKLTDMMCAHSGIYYLDGPDGEPTTYDESFFAAMVQAFDARLRDQDIPVDYDHRMERAAGWIKRLYTKDGDLWASIKWTPEGERCIRDGEYRYPSIAYCDKYRNPRTGMMGENVLISLAVTNYPALKGTQPITAFSEKDITDSTAADVRPEDNDNDEIDRKETEDMTDEQMKKMQEDLDKANAEKEEATKRAEKADADKAEAEKKLAEMEAAKAQAEAEKAAFERKTSYTQQMEALTLKNPDRAKSGEAVLRTEQLEEVVGFLMEITPEQAEKAVKMFSEMTPAIKIPLGVSGTSAGGAEDAEPMSDEMKARKAMENAKARKEWENASKREAILKEEEVKIGLRPAPAAKQ